MTPTLEKRKTGIFSWLFSVILSICFSSTMLISAKADWKDDLGTFRISIVINGNPSVELARMEPFRLAVSEKLGVPVEIIPARDLPTLIRNHAEGRNEYAVLSASAYGAAWSLCECVEPMVVASSSDGSIQSNSILISRKASPVSAPQNAVGKIIIALNKDSVLGYAYPVFELKGQNVDLLAGDTKFLFFDSAEQALAAFAKGEGDALLGWSSNIGEATNGFTRGSLAQLASMDPALLNILRVIWTSSGIAHRVHSIRKNLDGEAKRLLRELLMDLSSEDPVAYDAIEPDYSGGFVPANQTMFEAISAFAKSPIPGDSIPVDGQTDGIPKTGSQTSRN